MTTETNNSFDKLAQSKRSLLLTIKGKIVAREQEYAKAQQALKADFDADMVKLHTMQRAEELGLELMEKEE